MTTENQNPTTETLNGEKETIHMESKEVQMNNVENDNSGSTTPIIKSKPIKRKVNIHNYMKTFKDFKQGCEEIISIIPKLKDICGTFLTPEAVRSKLLDIVKEDIPYPSNPKYPDTLSISIDAHEFNIKLTNHIAFGCRTSFSSTTGEVFHSFRISFIHDTDPTNNDEYKTQTEKLKSLEWRLVQSVMQSNFWDKLEDKEKRTRRNKKFLFNHNKEKNKNNKPKKEFDKNKKSFTNDKDKKEFTTNKFKKNNNKFNRNSKSVNKFNKHQGTNSTNKKFNKKQYVKSKSSKSDSIVYSDQNNKTEAFNPVFDKSLLNKK